MRLRRVSTGWSIRGGLGHGTRLGQRLGTSASGVAAPFGLLRGHETNTPGHAINHAMQIVLPRQRRLQYHAVAHHRAAGDGPGRHGETDTGNNTGNIPYGGLLALPPTVNLETASASANRAGGWLKAFATTASTRWTAAAAMPGRYTNRPGP